jgi:hypothetical protein
LVYTLEEGNVNSDCLHIVDLEDNNKEMKVQGFGIEPEGTSFLMSEILF